MPSGTVRRKRLVNDSGNRLIVEHQIWKGRAVPSGTVRRKRLVNDSGNRLVVEHQIWKGRAVPSGTVRRKPERTTRASHSRTLAQGLLQQCLFIRIYSAAACRH